MPKVFKHPSGREIVLFFCPDETFHLYDVTTKKKEGDIIERTLSKETLCGIAIKPVDTRDPSATAVVEPN